MRDDQVTPLSAKLPRERGSALYWALIAGGLVFVLAATFLLSGSD
jgi:hypothetical protein